MNVPTMQLTLAERQQDQRKRDDALARLATCGRIVQRMEQELEVRHRNQFLWVPTVPFLEALEWAELQLCRARHVQERAR